MYLKHHVRIMDKKPNEIHESLIPNEIHKNFILT